MAPGSWVRCPFGGDPGYNHLPWWSNGIGDLKLHNAGNFYYVGGTSMATPQVAAAAALLLGKDPKLTQPEIEDILKYTAVAIPVIGSRDIWDNTVAGTMAWDTDCSGIPCDSVGAGMIQLDAAINTLS